MHFKMLSAICFNLNQPKILLFGNGLTITQIALKRLTHYPLPAFAENIVKVDQTRAVIECGLIPPPLR